MVRHGTGVGDEGRGGGGTKKRTTASVQERKNAGDGLERREGKNHWRLPHPFSSPYLPPSLLPSLPPSPIEKGRRNRGWCLRVAKEKKKRKQQQQQQEEE